MGSCHSLPLLLEKKRDQENNNKPTQCMLCCHEISIYSGIYVKCFKCGILLHNCCAKKYKSNTRIRSNILFCPHCKFRNSLYCYNNKLYNCKKL
jgi:hypothetical protein